MSFSQEADYSQFPTEVMERIAQQLDSAWLKLSQRDSHPRPRYRQFWHWLLTPFYWLTGQTSDAIINRLNKNIKKDVALTKDTPFALELIINRPHFEYWHSYVLARLSAAQEWLEHSELRQRILNRLNTLQQQLAERQQQQQELQSRLTTYPATDFYSRFYTDYHPLQIRLFELSWQFQQQEALRRKDEVTISIKTYISVLNGDWETKRQFRRDWLTVYRDLSLLFPVFLSTLHSLRRLFPYLHSGCIDQAIIDEAGQIPPHQPFPLLVRSQRAMLLGDPWQLEPVISLSESDRDVYRAKAFLHGD
ncbi:MAG: hypothetical protein HC820_01165 [Hydrococcus sp. RM1_1_31]|nr:hypothetical protein [Hydrococcus sp. RM1_1_31]